MNVKITLPELSAMMAETTGFDAKACELFLRELFATVAEALVAGENVKVKGLGSFKSIEVEQRKSVNVNTGEQMIIPTHRKVTFTPDKALAEAVNAPFAMFEPVEINDSVTDEMLEQATEPEKEYEPPLEVQPQAEIEKERDIIAEIQEHDQVEESDIDPEPDLPEPKATEQRMQTFEAEPEPFQEPELTYNAIEPTPAEDPAVPHIYTGQKDRQVPEPPVTSIKESTLSDHPDHTASGSRFGRGFLMGAISAIIFMGILLLCWHLVAPASLSSVFSNPQQPATHKPPTAKSATTQGNTVSADIPSADTTAAEPIRPAEQPEQLEVPTQPSDINKSAEPQKEEKPRYVMDKITKKRYLTTMARHYYGNYNLWPLIYDYNKGLGHPDRIRPGTKIKVPSAEELGIDPSDPAVLKSAKNRGREIYAKYR